MTDVVHFTLSGEITSRYWGYCAWVGSYVNKSAGVEKWPDEKYRVSVPGRIELLSGDTSPDALKEADEGVYAVIKMEADMLAQLFRTTVEDTATSDRANQLAKLATA